MKSRQIPNLSGEYIESMCDWLIEWSQKKDSLVISQFFEEKRIGYPFFKYMVENWDRFANTYEYVKAALSIKWINKVLDTPNMSNPQAKLALRYIRLYDSHGLDLEQRAKEAIALLEAKATSQFLIENYSQQELVEPYLSEFEKNREKFRKARQDLEV